MKKLFFLTLITTLFLGGCNKCKDIFYCELPFTGKKYFSAYKEGTYWIYYNSDSSKIDSVYLTDFSIERVRDKIDECIEYENISFNINSTYLFQNIERGIHENVNENLNSGCGMAVFGVGTNGFGFISENGNTLLSCSSNNCDKIDFFQLRNDPNLTFVEAYVYDNRFWVAPEVGLIQYISFNNTDTFYIHKYQVQ